MAFRVPIYESQVSQQEGSAPEIPALSAPPPSAFGTAGAAATEQLGNAVGRMGDVLAAHMIRREHQAQNAQVIQADNDFRVNLQKDMFDSTPDERGVPRGVYARNGFQAQGATMDFDNQFKTLRQTTMDSMDTPFKKQRLGELMDENYPRLRELVAKHEVAQTRIGQNSVVDGNLQLRIQTAPDYMNDTDGLLKSIQSGQQIKYNSMSANGEDGSKISATLNDFAGKVVRSSLSPLLATDPDAAQSFFDQIRSNKANPISPQDEESIQKLIDASRGHFKTKQARQLAIGTNNSEAELAGKIANGQLTPVELDKNKDSVSEDFYNLASVALKNNGVTSGTAAQMDSKAVSLMEEYGRITLEDEDKRTAAMMKFRKDILANSTKLQPEQFSKLLSWTDPHFVAAQVTPKSSWLKAGLDFITDHAKKYGGEASEAMTNFISNAMRADIKPSDIPAVAQAAVKSQVYQSNPFLMGRADVANNVADQQSGVRQVYGETTNLKPDVTISAPKVFKAGDEQMKNGVTYVRGEDGKWLPKR